MRSGCGVATSRLRMSEVAIRARGLAKHGGAGSSRRAILSGIDVDAEPGELVVIAGRSGSGKTTLMGILGGLIAQDEGEGAIFGRRLDDLDSAGPRAFLRQSIRWGLQ